MYMMKELFQKRVVRTKFDIYLFYFLYIDTQN